MEKLSYDCDGCGKTITEGGSGYNGRIDATTIILLSTAIYEEADFHLHPNQDGLCYGKLIAKYHKDKPVIKEIETCLGKGEKEV